MDSLDIVAAILAAAKIQKLRGNNVLNDVYVAEFFAMRDALWKRERIDRRESESPHR